MSDEDQTAAERVRELSIQLRVLRIREETANFENREAIRRAINEREAELETLLAGLGAPDGAETGTD